MLDDSLIPQQLTSSPAQSLTPCTLCYYEKREPNKRNKLK